MAATIRMDRTASTPCDPFSEIDALDTCIGKRNRIATRIIERARYAIGARWVPDTTPYYRSGK